MSYCKKVFFVLITLMVVGCQLVPERPEMPAFEVYAKKDQGFVGSEFCKITLEVKNVSPQPMRPRVRLDFVITHSGLIDELSGGADYALIPSGAKQSKIMYVQNYKCSAIHKLKFLIADDVTDSLVDKFESEWKR